MTFSSSIRWRLLLPSMLTICVAHLLTSASNAAGPFPVDVAEMTTTNQKSVGTALDHISATATGGLLNLINTLGAQTPNLQQSSLNQLSGEMFGSTQTIGIQVGDQFEQRIGTRLISNGHFLSGTPTSTSNDDSDDSEARGSLPTNTNCMWVQGYGVAGSLHSDGNGAGVRYSQGGALYGCDLGGDESGVIGIAFGNSYVGFHDGFDGYGHLNAYQFGLYAMKHNDTGYVLGTTNYGCDDFGTIRNVAVGGASTPFRGNFVGHQLGTYAESGLKLHYGWVHIQPLAGLQYLYLAQQGFGESGGVGALNVSASQADSLRTSLGGRLVIDQVTGKFGEVWTPYWHGRWVSELLDNDRIVNASFNGSPMGGAFTAHGTRLGQNYFNYGKGLQVQITDQWSLFGNVDLMFGGRIHSETGSLGLLHAW